MTPRDEQNAARTEAQLIALAKRRGYIYPEHWAKRIMEGRKKRYAHLKLVTVGGKRV